MGVRVFEKPYADFSGGINQESASDQIPDNCVWDMKNFLFTDKGSIYARGPILNWSNNTPSFGNYYAVCASSWPINEFAVPAGNPFKNPAIYMVGPYYTASTNEDTPSVYQYYADETTLPGNFSFSSFVIPELTDSYEPPISSTSPYWFWFVGKPEQCWGVSHVPMKGAPLNTGEFWTTLPWLHLAGGESLTGGKGTDSSANSTYTFAAESPIVTWASSAANTFWTARATAGLSGNLLYANNGTVEYIGRIVGIRNSPAATTTAAQIIVDPPPPAGFTVTGNGVDRKVVVLGMCGEAPTSTGPGLFGYRGEGGGGKIPLRTKALCVHQNRLVVAPEAVGSYTSINSDADGTLVYPNSSSLPDYHKNVLMWSAIYNESGTAANLNSYGILHQLKAGWPKSQSLTLDTAEIISLVSLDVNNLLVLCSDKVIMISGELGTILPGSNVDDNSINIRTVSTTASCVSDKTVQRTPYGIVFASESTVWLTNGTTFIDLGEGTMGSYLAKNLRPDNITGSAFFDGKNYFLSFGVEYLDTDGAGGSTISTSGFDPITGSLIGNPPQHLICDLSKRAWTKLNINTSETNGTTYNGFVSYGYSCKYPDGTRDITLLPRATPQEYGVATYVTDDLLYLEAIVDPFSVTSFDDAHTATPPFSELTTKSYRLADDVNETRLRSVVLRYFSKKLSLGSMLGTFDIYSGVTGLGLSRGASTSPTVPPTILSDTLSLNTQDYGGNYNPINLRFDTTVSSVDTISNAYSIGISSQDANFELFGIKFAFQPTRSRRVST